MKHQLLKLCTAQTDQLRFVSEKRNQNTFLVILVALLQHLNVVLIFMLFPRFSTIFQQAMGNVPLPEKEKKIHIWAGNTSFVPWFLSSFFLFFNT